ncbi:hypothetical protein P8V03_07075 [Clostridium sp. A1-XYC3]|uniref:Uncharacterized protein n=1 Tax=Clostridium tanneri TaxID=3037988 RepID=A0ABU4JS16_9CLOT|nr:hypothetical protein [Clostridium sp. A1-XYC3]MDW8800913.1 hypothetical protein [Clostridium sp. A1-XYC3]
MESKDKEERMLGRSIKENLDLMMSYGSENLGLYRVKKDNASKNRLEEDIKN